MVVRMMIFMCDNIGCLNEWVVSIGGVGGVVGVVDGCDVVFDVVCDGMSGGKGLVRWND